MRASQLFIRFVAALLMCVAPALAQTGADGNSSSSGGGESQRFTKDGLSFDYPAGWTLEDQSNADVQHLILTRAGGTALVRVVAYRERITTAEQLLAASQNIWHPYAEDLGRKLGVTKTPPWDEVGCQKVGGRTATGVRIKGQLGGRPSTGEVYALLVGGRYVNLFYVRADSADAAASPAWKTVLDTVKVEGDAGVTVPVVGDQRIISGGVLTGKAVNKAQPHYPDDAKFARAQGAVSVQIVVDEKGDVVSAKAVSGHPLLRKASERSAMQWKFTPTKLCGEPVKVSGVIVIKFAIL